MRTHEYLNSPKNRCSFQSITFNKPKDKRIICIAIVLIFSISRSFGPVKLSMMVINGSRAEFRLFRSTRSQVGRLVGVQYALSVR